MIELEKNRWNNNLKQYMKEDFYTKAEIDERFGGTTGYSTVTVIVTYTDSSTETMELLRSG